MRSHKTSTPITPAAAAAAMPPICAGIPVGAGAVNPDATMLRSTLPTLDMNATALESKPENQVGVGVCTAKALTMLKKSCEYERMIEVGIAVAS